jgi:hypothetical protein
MSYTRFVGFPFGRKFLATAVMSPQHAVRDALFAVPEVEQVYIWMTGSDRVTVLTVIGERNYAAQKRIFRAEAEIIDALPGIEIGFDVVIRDGRPLRDLISPRGTLLFARA